jgi:hypothetical protein
MCGRVNRLFWEALAVVEKMFRAAVVSFVNPLTEFLCPTQAVSMLA